MRLDLPFLASLLLTLPSFGQGSVEHVIHISVDGLSGSLLEDRVMNDSAGAYSNFRRLMDEGASTFNARTDYFRTNTLPNHTTMLSGRPVLQPTGLPSTVHHGWTSNSDPAADETLHNAGNPNLSYVASAFDVAHDHGLRTGLFASKDKFILFEQSYDADSGAPDLQGVDDGTDKIDTWVQQSAIQGPFLTEMGAQRFHYVFLHYRDPDGAGHANGWGSAEWDQSVQLVDDWIGEVLALVESDAVLAGRTVVLLSSDHGGTGTGHSTSSDVANYVIPFFAWGAGVEAGTDLYTLNAGKRLDPGTGRPTYGTTIAPVRNGDGGNLALDLLGLPAIPGSLINAAQDLSLGSAPVVAFFGCGVNPAGSLTVLAGAPSPGVDFVLGVDDPTGTFAPGALPFLMLSSAPAPNYPCGILAPNLGFTGPGAILVDLSPGPLFSPLFLGAPWTGTGTPAAVTLSVPSDATLVGRSFFVQGGLFDPSAPAGQRVGLAEALAFTVGT